MQERALEIKVGAVLLAALVVLAGFALFLGDFGFERGMTLNVDYGFSGPIQTGAPVKISGVKVGRVKALQFLGARPKDDAAQVRLVLFVESRAQPALTEGAQFFVNTQGLLGEHYVEIIPAASPGPRLTDGASVRGVDPPRFDLLIQTLYDFIDAMSRLLTNNEALVQDLVRSAASLARALDGAVTENRTSLDQTIQNAATASEEAATLLARLNTVVGDGGALKSSVADVSVITRALRDDLPPALVKLDKALGDVQRISAALEGVDRKKVDALLAHTTAAAARADAVLADAKRITRRIDSGTGTLGLLLKDDEIFDDLKALIRDVKQHPWKLVWKQ